MKFIHREVEFNLFSQNRINYFFEENDLKKVVLKDMERISRIAGQ